MAKHEEKHEHEHKKGQAGKLRNVCDSDDELGFNEQFTWNNPSREDCKISPRPGSEWPFADPKYVVYAGSTAPGQTKGSPPLHPNKRMYSYDVDGGDCKVLTQPKNVLIP